MRSLFYNFIAQQHSCYLNSINGYEMCPKTWAPFIDKQLDIADIDFTYTMPKNFKSRFKSNSKLKLAIYNYETNILPVAWKDKYKDLDFLLPSSTFSKSIFVDNGWPEEKCIVVPHGIHPDEFLNKSVYKLQNEKKFRFLNVSIPHFRKNIDLVVDTYYDTFSENEDVCLVLKTSLDTSKKKYVFEVNLAKQLKEIQFKHLKLGKKKLPQIEIVQDKLSSMIPLYNACHSLVSASSSEGFGLPLLEGLAANLIVIAPNATGQLDFLNLKNSLLVDTITMIADKRYQYWKADPKAITYMPIKKELSIQMRSAFDNHQNLLNKFSKNRQAIISKFTWENAAKQIIEIANENIRL